MRIRMSTTIEPKLDVKAGSGDDGGGAVDETLGASGFEPPAMCEDDDARDFASGVPEAIYLPGSNLNGSDFFPTLEGLDDEAPFERASKRAKLDGSGEFPCSAPLGDHLGPSDAVPETSLTELNDNSALLMKLLSSTDVEADLAPEGLGSSHAIYSALVGLAAASDSSKPTQGSSSSSTSPPVPSSSAAGHSPRKGSAPTQAAHSGPALILCPELFSAAVPTASTAQPSLTTVGAVTTPTIGRSTRSTQASTGTGKFAGAHHFPNDDVNGPVRVVRRAHGWVTILRNGGRQATGPYRETVHQCVEDQKEVHRLRVERGMANSEVMQLLEQMKHVTDRHPSTLLIKKPKKLDYVAPIGVRRMHKGFRASVRVSGREVYGPLRQEVADATCDRAEMMKYRHVVDAPGMRAFVKTLRDRVYPHHQGTRRQVAEAPSPSRGADNQETIMPIMHS
ncbi:hypothetical protein FOZ63_005260 [Perkinsus olseni]|uniref:Uncharacterized protein n=1 Tax=Perkinsus olseni TaxID=32597 RepID=A0A7J6QSP5_PEROL|nr:hypothetical protein FOZ63_005260 [Perkinsus olseni]